MKKLILTFISIFLVLTMASCGIADSLNDGTLTVDNESVDNSSQNSDGKQDEKPVEIPDINGMSAKELYQGILTSFEGLKTFSFNLDAIQTRTSQSSGGLSDSVSPAPSQPTDTGNSGPGASNPQDTGNGEQRPSDPNETQHGAQAPATTQQSPKQKASVSGNNENSVQNGSNTTVSTTIHNKTEIKKSANAAYADLESISTSTDGSKTQGGYTIVNIGGVTYRKSVAKVFLADGKTEAPSMERKNKWSESVEAFMPNSVLTENWYFELPADMLSNAKIYSLNGNYYVSLSVTEKELDDADVDGREGTLKYYFSENGVLTAVEATSNGYTEMLKNIKLNPEDVTITAPADADSYTWDDSDYDDKNDDKTDGDGGNKDEGNGGNGGKDDEKPSNTQNVDTLAASNAYGTMLQTVKNFNECEIYVLASTNEQNNSISYYEDMDGNVYIMSSAKSASGGYENELWYSGTYGYAYNNGTDTDFTETASNEYNDTIEEMEALLSVLDEPTKVSVSSWEWESFSQNTNNDAAEYIGKFSCGNSSYYFSASYVGQFFTGTVSVTPDNPEEKAFYFTFTNMTSYSVEFPSAA